STLIAIEKEIQLGELKKRFDVLVFDNSHKPWMIIECKAAEVKLNNDVIDQVMRYNLSVPSTYLVITNGNETYGWERQSNQLLLLDELPDWK
ncbi:MAG: type I restriction enzyme HsdR N-terminal domain-containing protein, partial [Chitinophagaceae bacterium]